MVLSSGTRSRRYRFSMVCANNVNRSTEAHDRLYAAGMDVQSFGAGTKVQFPGPRKNDPRVYEFGTPYEKMYADLKAENEELFTRNGVLAMLERDMKTKRAPQRWQEQPLQTIAGLDVVVCFEDRIWDLVVDDLQSRDYEELKAVHVICMDIIDSPEGAKSGGALALQLCQEIEKLNDLESQLPDLIELFEDKHNIKMLYGQQYV